LNFTAYHAGDAIPLTTRFAEPGGTIGSSPRNHLVLEQDADIGRVQTIVRIDELGCRLMNVGSRARVLLNGRVLPLLQEAPFAPGDELIIGAYTVRIDAAWAALPADGMATLPMADADAAGTGAADTGEPDDVFRDLLQGPGVLPVGTAAGITSLHPFELDSQAQRNHPDPLRALRDTAPDTPFAGSLDTRPDSRQSDIFTNPTPSTLDREDPLASQRRNVIDEALRAGRANDSRYENR